MVNPLAVALNEAGLLPILPGLIESGKYFNTIFNKLIILILNKYFFLKF